MQRVRLLELAAGDVRQLRLGDKVLGFGAHEFLLEEGDAGGGGVFVFEAGDFFLNPGFVVPGGLDGRFGVADGFKDRAVVFKGLRVVEFLSADFGEEDAKFVGDVGDGVVACGGCLVSGDVGDLLWGGLTSLLAPFAQLRRDMYPLPARALVRIDDLVFILDQAVQPLAQLRYAAAAFQALKEATLRPCGRWARGDGPVLGPAKREGSVPAGGRCG